MKRKTRSKAQGTADGNYTVGFGRPPVAGRFKPGQSGNPKGRRRGTKNLSTLLTDILAEKISVRDGDKVRKISKAEALIHRLVAKALGADPKAAELVIKLAREQGQFLPEAKINGIEVSFIVPKATKDSP